MRESNSPGPASASRGAKTAPRAVFRAREMDGRVTKGAVVHPLVFFCLFLRPDHRYGTLRCKPAAVGGQGRGAVIHGDEPGAVEAGDALVGDVIGHGGVVGGVLRQKMADCATRLA